MRAKKNPSKGSVEKTVRAIRRATRRRYAAEEKIRIVLQGLRGEESIAELRTLSPVTAAFAPLDQPVSIQHRVNRADRGGLDHGVLADQLVADLRRTPARMRLLDPPGSCARPGKAACWRADTADGCERHYRNLCHHTDSRLYRRFSPALFWAGECESSGGGTRAELHIAAAHRRI